MTTGIAFQPPSLRQVDQLGVPMNGAKLQFFLTGTTTPSPAYTDKTLGTPLSNPVVCDSAGLFPPMYLDPTITYRVQLLTAANSLIQDTDPAAAPFVNPAGSITAAMLASGAALSNLGFTPLAKAGDTATNLQLTNAALFTNSAGYLGAPVNNQGLATYTLALGDAGRAIRSNGITTGNAYTIPPVASVAWPIGTAIVIRNVVAGAITITRGAGVTLTIAGSGTSKDVSMAQWGFATMVMEDTNTWVISGIGLS